MTQRPQRPEDLRPHPERRHPIHHHDEFLVAIAEIGATFVVVVDDVIAVVVGTIVGAAAVGTATVRPRGGR